MMSKEGYHRGPVEDGPMDSLGLPPLPNTSYWYEAHSSMGSSLYPSPSPMAPLPTSQLFHTQPYSLDGKLVGHERLAGYDGKSFEGKLGEYREPVNWWMEDERHLPYQPLPQPMDMEDMEDRHVYTPSGLADGGRGMQGPPAMAMMYGGAVSPRESAGMVAGGFIDPLDEAIQGGNLEQPSTFPAAPSATHLQVQNLPEPGRRPDTKGGTKGKSKKDPGQKEAKAKDGKRCGVCGDAARSMHFGGMACDSCKAFFRRSVQSGAYKNFTCSGNENCPISKQNRKICQYCRFKKSRENGMEVSWVMSETDRMVLWKNRLAKQRQEQEDKIKDEVYGGLPHTLSPDHAEHLKSLAALQEVTFKAIPYPEDCYGDSVEAMANLFVCICKKLGLFFYRVEDFQELCKLDQSLLLKNGIGMGIYLHGAYMFDYEKEKWPAENNNEALAIPPVSVDTLQTFTVYPEAFNAIMKFYRRYSRIIKDEIILALICVIAFFQPDDPNFIQPQKIQDIQSKYLEYLQIYLQAKEGDTGVKVTFPKLLVGLADIREILEFHGKVDIKPTINHQEISSQPSMKNQMAILKDLFEKVSLGQVPEFSSVLSSKEKKEPLWNRSSALQKRHQGTPGDIRNNQFYHPYTNQIFGRDPRTDMIITNPLDNIEKFLKKHRHSFTQMGEGSNRPQRKLQGLAPANIKELKDGYQQPGPEGRDLQLVSSSSVNFDEKKRSVEVLFDVMKQICNDDGRFVQGLRRDLPPQLLRQLAHKLLPS